MSQIERGEALQPGEVRQTGVRHLGIGQHEFAQPLELSQVLEPPVGHGGLGERQVAELLQAGQVPQTLVADPLPAQIQGFQLGPVGKGGQDLVGIDRRRQAQAANVGELAEVFPTGWRKRDVFKLQILDRIQAAELRSGAVVEVGSGSMQRAQAAQVLEIDILGWT